MIYRSDRFAKAVGCMSLLVLTACSGATSRVKPPRIDPDEAGQLAISQYDTNADGALSKVELDKCPGVKRAIRLYDTNGDSTVSEEEIVYRIRGWQERRVGMMSVTCSVRMDGRPLSGATIRLVPEKYLGDNVKIAAGITIEDGMAFLAIDDADLPEDQKGLGAVHVGVYKVQITHPSRSIPAKYNTNTTLGIDVAQDNPEILELVFNVTSR